MLKTVKTMKELDFTALMQIYLEGNEEKAAEYGDGGLLLAEREFYDYLHSVFFQTPGAFYCIWHEEGKAVSALRLEPYRDGWLLEALETAPEHRRKGYAKALMKAALDNIDGKPVYSHVSKHNEASLRTHIACGFEKYLDYAVYVDGSVSPRAWTLRFSPK